MLSELHSTEIRIKDRREQLEIALDKKKDELIIKISLY